MYFINIILYEYKTAINLVDKSVYLILIADYVIDRLKLKKGHYFFLKYRIVIRKLSSKTMNKLSIMNVAFHFGKKFD